MKLLDPREVKDLQRIADNESRKRTVAISTILATEEKRLNDLRTNKTAEITRMQLELDSSRIAIMDEKRALLNEVEALEKRKRAAEKSLEPIRQALDNEAKELHEREMQLNKHQAYLEKLQDEVELKADQLACDQDDLEKLVQRSTARIAQEENRIAKLKALQIEAAQSAKKINQEAEETLAAATWQAMKVRQDADVLSAKETWLKNQQSILQTEQAHLASQQQSLKTAFSEARKKNLL